MKSSATSSRDESLSKLVTIHQPDFLPWLGFFDRWRKSDLYVVLDDVQFLRRGWHHRDKIKTASGEAWLTVPVQKKGKFEQTIAEALIDDERDWRRKHLNAIEAAYKKTRNFLTVFPVIEKIYEANHKLLVDLNLDLLRYCAQELYIETPLKRASELGITATGTERLVQIVSACGGERYLTGLGAKDYLDEDIFTENGIEVVWQKFEHPVYTQLHGPFVQTLSVLDYLMNVRDRRAWD